MAPASKLRQRAHGEIETLPSGSLRVRVYAGIDPVSRKKHYLIETVPAGPKAAKEAERVCTRLLNQETHGPWRGHPQVGETRSAVSLAVAGCAWCPRGA